MLFTGCMLFPLASANSDPAEIHVMFLAAPVKVAWKDFSPGHAFFIISLHINSGIKEESYGFYPDSEQKNWFIGGPGVIENEFKKNPKRLSVVEDSFSCMIDETKRKKIYQVIYDWNKERSTNNIDTKDYNLFVRNCIDFIDKILESIEMTRPKRNPIQTPVQYLNELSKIHGDTTPPAAPTGLTILSEKR